MSVQKVLYLADATRAALDFASSGANTIVASVAGKRVKIVSVFLMANDDVNVTFEDSDGNDLTGPLPMGTKGNGFVLPPSEIAWLQTPVGKGLQIRLNGAVQMSGSIIYVQE
jgi:hypothetical protein